MLKSDNHSFTKLKWEDPNNHIYFMCVCVCVCVYSGYFIIVHCSQSCLICPWFYFEFKKNTLRTFSRIGHFFDLSIIMAFLQFHQMSHKIPVDTLISVW